MYFELLYLRERDIATDTEVEFSLRTVTRRIRKNFYKQSYSGTGGADSCKYFSKICREN
jgi:hypothetical protein